MMQTRSSQQSVLGKRSHHTDTKQASVEPACPPSMPTPELTPKLKRRRVSLCSIDGDCNKENVPPCRAGAPPTLRRTSTEIITPSRPQSSVGRYASASATLPATPTTSVSALAVTTPPPTPHSTLFPVYARARALLRATCNGSSPIAGRTSERETIKQFISCSWANSSNSSLFISGTPGTGKTALVNAVLDELGDDCGCDVISVNCMAHRNLDSLWDHLRDTFAPSERVKGSPKKAKLKGKPLLDELLMSRKRRCLLVLDELDHIATSSQTLSSIFSLSRKYVTTLRIVAIANTHTLTASTTLLGDDAAGISTLHFGGYTSSQLLDVLTARLSSLLEDSGGRDPGAQAQAHKFFPMATLTLLAKKVASQTGDVRMLFGVLRGAIDLAVSSAPSSEDNPLVVPTFAVTPNHVLAALKAYLPSKDMTRRSATASTSTSSAASISEIATKVRSLGLQARLVLLSMLLATKRMEVLLPLSYSLSSPPKTPVKRAGSTLQASRSTGLDLAQLHTYYSAILERAESGVFTPVCRSEFADLIGVLETSGLVSSSTLCSLTASPSKSGRRGFGRSASFGGAAKGAVAGQDIRIADTVRGDEVLRGLGVAEADVEVTDPREEEIRAIWVRETARITKDVKGRAQSRRNPDDMIEGAFER